MVFVSIIPSAVLCMNSFLKNLYSCRNRVAVTQNAALMGAVIIQKKSHLNNRFFFYI